MGPEGFTGFLWFSICMTMRFGTLVYPIRLAGQNESRILMGGDSSGRVAEWLKAPDSKSGVGVILPEVRILSLPPIPFSHELVTPSITWRESIAKQYRGQLRPARGCYPHWAVQPGRGPSHLPDEKISLVGGWVSKVVFRNEF
jgi:hypothetical protein